MMRPELWDAFEFVVTMVFSFEVRKPDSVLSLSARSHPCRTVLGPVHAVKTHVPCNQNARDMWQSEYAVSLIHHIRPLFRRETHRFRDFRDPQFRTPPQAGLGWPDGTPADRYRPSYFSFESLRYSNVGMGIYRITFNWWYVWGSE